MISFEKFMNNPITVKVHDVDEFNHVVRIFNANCITDEFGNQFRESDPYISRSGSSYPIYVCATADKKHIEKHLSPNYFEENKWQIISGFELVDEEPEVVREIHISCKDGRLIEAEYFADGKQVDKDIITCSNPDEKWFGYGSRIVVDDLFNWNDEVNRELKAGDVVRIRADLRAEKEYGCETATDDMKHYRGDKMVIKEVITDTYGRTKYRLYGDHCQWNWTKEMFE